MDNFLSELISDNSEIELTEFKYNDLSNSELDEISKICQNWLVPNINEDFPDKTLMENLEDLYGVLVQIDFSPIVKAFSDRLGKIEYNFTEEEELSGSIVFMGGIITSLLHFGYITDLEGLFTFALTYLLIDHFLDDDTISKVEKYKNMLAVYNFIEGGNNEIDNPIIRAAADNYTDLITRNPQCEPHLKALFRSEIKGTVIQKNPHLKRETYHQIALEKGGLTGQAMASIIGLDVNDDRSHYDLAACLQLEDDLQDQKCDSEQNIYTLARYDFDHGHLDNYIYETFTRINLLPSVYNFFKVVLLYLTLLGIHDHREAISQKLLDLIEPYIPFDHTTSKETINHFFHHKLFGYVQEKGFR